MSESKIAADKIHEIGENMGYYVSLLDDTAHTVRSIWSGEAADVYQRVLYEASNSLSILQQRTYMFSQRIAAESEVLDMNRIL